MRINRRWVAAGAAIVCAGCVTGSHPRDLAEPRTAREAVAIPPAGPFYDVDAATGTTYQQSFSSVAVGAVPSDWRNEADTSSYPWLVAGNWTVLAAGGGHVLAQTRVNWPWYGDAPPLSFMRFNAPTFGQPGNGLPDRYEVDVGLKVVACDGRDPYYPIGDTGVQVYYLDPTHYCEMVYRPRTVELWQCNGGQPFRFTGWTLLYRQLNSSHAGQELTVHARVDVNAHTLQAWLPGWSGPLTVHPAVIQPRAHWMTLRASNSAVQYDHVTIRQL